MEKRGILKNSLYDPVSIIHVLGMHNNIKAASRILDKRDYALTDLVYQVAL